MNYHISDKMSSLKPSVIREIFKHTSDPSVISFAAGSPAPETLPVEAIRDLLAQALAENPGAALMYSQSEGHPPFRQAVREYLSHLMGEEDDVIITSGAQQGVDLFCKVLCNEGDTILVEQPSFIGSLNTFRSYGTQLVGVDIEADGIDLAMLEQQLQTQKNVRFIYVIPNFQNPSGITMSLEKRQALYQLALRHNVMIFEDNPYGDLRFEGEPIPSIKSMDTHGIVAYIGTFSKILAPGIRVGYLVAPSQLMAKIVVAKQCTDVHTSMLAQLLCHKFLTTQDVAQHIRQGSQVYAHKCRLMLGEMDKKFPKSVQYTRPSGGLFIWATLPQGVDGDQVAKELVQRKVAVVPGSASFVESTPEARRNLRFNFSTPSDQQIIDGIDVVATYLQQLGI